MEVSGIFCVCYRAMQTLTEELVRHGLANRLLTDSELRWLLEGSDQRRRHLVNRAVKAGELLRLRRGHYVLSNPHRDYPPHPFALAQAFVPGSYISFETALAHHEWIPEAVRIVASITPGRKTLQTTHLLFGDFSLERGFWSWSTVCRLTGRRCSWPSRCEP